MVFTTASYFNGEITLPDNPDSNLDDMISRYEPVILKKLLGYELWKLVDDYSSSSDQRIIDLVEGKEYTVSYNGRDQTIKWKGLENTDKVNLQAYYIYYWVQRNNATQTANVGEVKPSQRNSDVASSRNKQASSWFKMRELYGYYCQDELEPSAFNFLTEFSDDYPEWVFKEIGEINMFGL